MNNHCARPGCNGKMEDGYCDTCGRAPAVGAAASPAGGVSARGSGITGSAAGGRGSTAGTLGTTGSGRTGSTGSSGSRRGSRGTTRRSLGAGLIHLEPLPTIDPMQSVLADPVVPESKRYCPSCNAKLSLVRGFCPMCGTEYSFVPTLKPGDVVAGQYEVKGAIAFGGLGWIYLGWDNALSRWVVLKGLLNSKDVVGAQAAVAERQFLAAVKHPNIVGVYNFVTQGADGYIIMEYVGGKTLKTIRKERGGPLPVAEAIAYIHRILLAFGYLHRLGLVYCDFKPDNFMVEGDDVKLIDMGGVRRIDDVDGDIYGTKGYSAPEAGDGPTFTTDLYTVARTLAVLLMDFPFQGGKHEFFLPSPSEQAVLAQNESLYRLLIKATHKDPDERFQTADEMAAQLIGVLRETVSFDGTPRPVESTVFGGDNVSLADLEAPDARVLPVPKPDAQDPAAGAILSAASLTDPDQVAALFERAMAQFPESVEAPLLLAHARINQNRYAEAEKLLKDAESLDPFDWQITWLRGLSRMMQNKTADAKAAFDKVYGEVPGELAPKLALAFAAEQTGDMAAAIRFYEIVVRTDPSFTSAAFGLARCRIKTKDRAGAIAAYNRIPTASRLHVPAQMALARVLVQTELSPPGVAELEQASNAITGISIDGYLLHQLSVEVLRAAIHQVEAKAIPTGTSGKVLGQPLQSRALREAVEKELRAMARHAKTRDEKIDLIDAANRERPRTLV